MPFIPKTDLYRQIAKVKRQLKKMPFHSLKSDVRWVVPDLSVDKPGKNHEGLNFIEGMTLSEELIKFAEYVSVRDFSKCLQ